MQTLLHHDCWRVCLCGDSSTDFTSDRADLSGAVGGKKGFCASPRVFFLFFSCNTFRPADYDIYEQYVLAAHVWMMVSFVFVQGAGGDVMIK